MGAKGLQNRAKMEVRRPPETVSDADPVQNGKISNPYIIYYTLATSATPENRRFSSLRAPKTPQKIVSTINGNKVGEKEPHIAAGPLSAVPGRSGREFSPFWSPWAVREVIFAILALFLFTENH